MKIKILNNSLSPSFLIDTIDEKILVNTPKGFYYPLNERIDSVLFTSDDLYHTYDILQLKYINKNKILNCYVFKEFIPNIKKLISEYDLPLMINEIKPYKEFKKGIMPLFLHKKQLSIYSNISMGLKLENTTILPIFKDVSNKTKEFLKDSKLVLLTLKYLKKNYKNNSISVEEVIEEMEKLDIENFGFIGLSKQLKNSFDKQYIKINNILKIY